MLTTYRRLLQKSLQEHTFYSPVDVCIHAQRTLRIGYRYTHQGSKLPVPPAIGSLTSSGETAQAHSWLEQFRAIEIPKGSVELTFSRSSGPGGQNVNKVNTKATLRCPLNTPWIPMWAIAELRKSPHYVASTHSILITSTAHRSQSQNIDECLSKLHAVILSASSAPIKNEPTEAQKKKVEGLVRADKARKKVQKSHRSEIKKNRSGGDWY